MRPRPEDVKGINRKGKWTEIYTRREKDIKSDLEHSDGHLHGEGWACTCGCNKRIPNRKHSEGPPKDECDKGYHYTTGGNSEAYRRGYENIEWNK